MTDTRINESSAAGSSTAGAHGKLNHAVATARDGAHKALDSTRTTASDAARKAGEAIEANPVAILAGGLALGALAGALLPRTEREAELIGPVGRRLANSARSAASAALDTGKTELAAAGLNKDTLQAQAKTLLESVIGALGEAGKAAAKAGTGKGA